MVKEKVAKEERKKEYIMITENERENNGKGKTTDDREWSAISALLGFANKAGKLKFGLSACYQSCTRRKARLVLLTKDLSMNTRRKIEVVMEQNGIKSITYGTKEQFGLLFNRSDTGLISVEDGDFASGIEKAMA